MLHAKPAMTLVQLISQYGYLAVFVGALLEGEAILVLAGFAAQQGHLSLAWVLAIAFVGGTLGDQIFFWLGKRWGGGLLRRIPGARESTLRVSRLLQRYDAWLVFGIRFMYGLRIAGPIAMGALGVAPRRFAIFNVLGMRWPLKVLCTDFAMTQRTAHRLAELEYSVAAFTHGPEIRERPRERIRTFLARRG